MNKGLYVSGLIASFALGSMTSSIGNSFGAQPAEEPKQQRAYLVAGWEILSPPEALRPFSDAAVPLAKRAGLKILAHKQPRVLEGKWPYSGVLIVQEYSSMNALLGFWRSPEHEAARKLREGRINSHFVIAVEALEAPIVPPAK